MANWILTLLKFGPLSGENVWNCCFSLDDFDTDYYRLFDYFHFFKLLLFLFSLIIFVYFHL